MASRQIRVFGAREHNLKNINVDIPRQSLTVITGLSGSGKSSLAFDTLYAEGQRRYMESLSAYARQFLDQLPKPHVERIEGLSPAISIEQKTTSRNPRSTVGTVTEIYDYLRLLYSTIGQAHCPVCGAKLIRQTVEDITNAAMALPERTRVVVLAPVIRGRKGEYQALFQKVLKEGIVRAKIDGKMVDLEPTLRLKKQFKHDISLVIDRIVITPDARMRLHEAVKNALRRSDRLVILEIVPDSEGKFPRGVAWEGERLFSEELGCPEHGPQIVEMAPRVFSFNSRYGACPTCDGLGAIPEFDEERMIPNPNISLHQGAIGPFKWHFARRSPRELKEARNLSSITDAIHRVVEAMEIDLNQPWRDIPKSTRDVLLHGTKKKIPGLHAWGGLLTRLAERLEENEESGEFDAFADYLRMTPCSDCKGARLRPESLAVTMGGRNISQVCQLNIRHALDFFNELPLDERQREIAQQPLRQVTDRLGFLLNVGLHYLTLDREAGTLSGGEAQRIRLATQIGSRLRGVLYILDEPSIGLHQRDNEKLIQSLCKIRDAGNTVLVVEHDEQTIRTADYVVDLGPGAGKLGGEIVAAGRPEQIIRAKESLTGRYLQGDLQIVTPRKRRQPTNHKLVIEGCTLHNLKDVTLELPVGLMIGITGVSGSGKSSLIMETLLPLLMNHCYKASHQVVGPHRQAAGIEHFDRCINVDQTPIGRTPRSNPATYTKLLDQIRDLFAITTDAKIRGFTKSRFSFNTKGGRCEECSGQGSVKVEMNFLPDVYVECESCHGRRYNQETMEVKYNGKSIADVLEMTVDEAVQLFAKAPLIARPLQTLQDVGLGYIHLGQSALTLSGGEAQRIKLARELSKKNTGRSLYILDEPTTGLHFADVHKLIEVLNKLVAAGSTVLVIEHNLDVIKNCDWLIDLGPEGGEHGGEIIAQGPPELIAKSKQSETGRFLKTMLGRKAAKAV
ncbi:excinuclease ABC subunit UvrA [Candidatus Sumerlaeota bacterium]|nr:excinuclease ABC subunit UvrA [Candidatus Sumerlaeota bacterium]